MFQNDSSSLLSPAELPAPQEPQPKDSRQHTSNSDYIGRSESLPSDEPDSEPHDQGLDSGQGLDIAAIKPMAQYSVLTSVAGCRDERFDLQNHVDYETSLSLSERDSELCINTARCCRDARAGSCGVADCARVDEPSVTASPGTPAAHPVQTMPRLVAVATEKTWELDGKIVPVQTHHLPWPLRHLGRTGPIAGAPRDTD
ncbi:hypothetical protein EVAR_63706_1 [Eumeta japonica]|uniref:Uncharacterized protein n=1 Tax=Eumeta variegata TaxID=151549 RepID=A0A4C1ZZH4_EUMVA|nr:hypothetical protein EVAR_63706_1 [Eumeta japonica]